MSTKHIHRKTSSRRKGEPRATQATSDRLKELWATPEFREKMNQRDRARIAAATLNPAKFSRYGVPDSMRRAEAKLAWAKAGELADRFITVLKQNGGRAGSRGQGRSHQEGQGTGRSAAARYLRQKRRSFARAA